MKTQTKELALSWQIAFLTLLCTAVILLPDLSFAAQGDTPIGDMLCTVVGWFTGNTGKGIATIAIIVIGVGALLGKVSWGMAIIVGIGVALIFGASSLVNTLGTSGGGCGDVAPAASGSGTGR